MDASEIRLECLRLAHKGDAAPEAVVARARQYAEFAFCQSATGIVPADNIADVRGPRDH
jgi:hypothetical protein